MTDCGQYLPGTAAETIRPNGKVERGNITSKRATDRRFLYLSPEDMYPYYSPERITPKKTNPLLSILGPHPNLLHTLNPIPAHSIQPNSTLTSHQNPKSHNPRPHPVNLNLPQPPTHCTTMTSFTDEDEALIQKFVGLHTGECSAPPVALPSSASASTAWDLALLVKVVSDRTVLDDPFASAMRIAWAADPTTIFKPVAKNCFLIEFSNHQDLQRAQLNGPWTFRGDVVATKRVTSHLDLSPSHIAFENLWVLFFHVPINSLNHEGYDIMAREVGTPLTPPVHGYFNGIRFVKMKITIAIHGELKDRVQLTHPTLGTLNILCSYEKVSRACRFCGKLGHEIHTCPVHQRLAMLLQDPVRRAQLNVPQILAPKKGAWLTDASLIPRDLDHIEMGQVRT